MITFIVRQGPTPAPTPPTQKRSRPVPDVASTDWNGRHYDVSSITGAAMALARKLAADGCPEQNWEARGTSGDRRFFGRSLHRLAKLVIYESDSGRMRIRPWNALSASTIDDLHGVEAFPATSEAAD